MTESVKVWEENVLIPTYGIGAPEKNPMFLEKRVYQGSSGVVYPYPVIEKIEDTCEDKEYHAIYLENKYIKLMILPELGGRIQMAYDKIKKRHFIYYNQVIKPALVGLTGPWISGGIEFNWPQHHRPSTFLPVDYSIEKCEDGSTIVWVSERERMFHQKGTAGFVLHPDKAYLEIKGKVSNPTPFPQTFLWWANPAVAVNDEYQSVFPDDVNAVFDHGKRDVSRYPIATGTYYKMDYSAGVDISRYKNIPVPTSYMAIKSKYNFIGGYENDTRAGVLHVANHNVSPGKKQWTWGNGEFGQAWDRNLTDSDGPYIELMTGVYTDNQPDFSWLQPYEEKTFTQYFMPYRELGVVKNATQDVLMNIVEEEGELYLLLFATSEQRDLKVIVKDDDKEILNEQIDLTPEEIYRRKLSAVSMENIRFAIYNSKGKLLMDWEAEKEEIKEMPEAAKPALAPEDILTTEELYLTGLHLEQYRHATYKPTEYYEEALKRDPSDARNNNALGLWWMRKGQFTKAEPYFRQAIKTLTGKNPNPYDGEPYYNLGMCLKYQQKYDEAYDAFYKACWNSAWQDAGYFSLAQISAIEEEWQRALEEVEKSLLRNWHSLRGRHLKSIILRKLGKKDVALALINDSIEIDAFNYGCEFEKYLLTGNSEDLYVLIKKMRHEGHNYEELVSDYISAGCYEDALTLIDKVLNFLETEKTLLYYYRSYALQSLGRKDEAIEALSLAEKQSPSYCFPNSLESLVMLEQLNKLPQSMPMAHYYLGNLWYDKRQYQNAVREWELCVREAPAFPTAYRNLSLAYFNKFDESVKAVEYLEKAFSLDMTDARVLMELDQLYKRLNRSHNERLSILDEHKCLVEERDDLYLEYVTLLNQLGRYEDAIAMLERRHFHPWEGGEGKVIAQYQIACLEIAKKELSEKKYKKALPWIEKCFIYPENFGEGKLYGARENDFNYYKGCILEGLGRTEEAHRCFERATHGTMEPVAAIYYNDQKPDKIFYQGLSFRALGNEKKAASCFNRLIDFGERHIFDDFKIDYFAVSLPDLQIWEDDMNKRNRIHCNYLMGLGHLGLGEVEKAKHFFRLAAAMDNNHQGVQLHLDVCKNPELNTNAN